MRVYKCLDDAGRTDKLRICQSSDRVNEDIHLITARSLRDAVVSVLV